MKRVNQAGATLLEIMLVLAIGAMVIVMSVRYYQSATTSQQANVLAVQIQTVVAAADALAQGPSGYSNVTPTNVQNAVGGSAKLTTPWGTVAPASASPTGYNIVITNVPPGVCSLVVSQMTANPRLTTGATCATTATLTFAYDSTK